MKNKILIIVVVLLVLAIGVAIGIFLSKGEKEKGPGSIYGPEAKEGGTVLEKENFSINLPKGWAEMGTPTGVSAMAVNVSEEITDPNAQKINFRTYFAVMYDNLAGKSLEEYIQLTKESLSQAISDIVITFDKGEKINNRDTHFIEAEFNQKGIDFKILSAMIRGTGEDIWVINFNTSRSNWDEYKDLFYQTVDSFQVK